MSSTQGGQIVDGHGETDFLKQFANGRIDRSFDRLSNTGMKLRFTGPRFALQHEFDVCDLCFFDRKCDNNVITGTNGSHDESNKQRRTNKATRTVLREDEDAPKLE
jgi:hypothetical protein